MPFSAADIAKASKAALDFYLKNDPIDQIAVERPLLAFLQANKSPFPGGVQYIVEQLRKSYDGNLQSYRGDAQVTYNTRDPLAQAKFLWTNYHDGFGMTEDEMRQNGIILNDDSEGNATKAEVVQLNNLLKEYYYALKQGCQEGFDLRLHQDGTAGPDEIVGLDALISTTPNTGTVGGIDAAANPWWRNYAKIGVTPTALDQECEIAWRACTKNGGMPDKIFAGAAWIDAYRANAKGSIDRHIVITGQTQKMDVGVNALNFKGVEIVWDPTFEALDTIDSPTVPWTKRAYFVNSKHIRLRPAQGSEWVNRSPARPYDKYVHFRAMTWTGGLTCNRRNAHAVVAIA